MTSIFKNFLPRAKTLLAHNNLNQIVRFEHGRLGGATHRCNNLEKRFLVWTGKYKTLAEVPDYVNQNVMERTRNRMRIRIANYMMALTIVGCIAMAYSGKKAAQRGESVVKQNLEWHRQQKAE